MASKGRKGWKGFKAFWYSKEAIAYAKTVANNQEGNIVIHKVDGKIRKQDYSKPTTVKEEKAEKAETQKEKKPASKAKK